MMMLSGPRHSSGAHDFPAPLEWARSNEGVFSGGGVSLESWSPSAKPLCHRHPACPHPSGVLWTPAEGDSTKRNFALVNTCAGRLDDRCEPRLFRIAEGQRVGGRAPPGRRGEVGVLRLEVLALQRLLRQLGQALDDIRRKLRGA